jgi:hypothetical protein
VGTQFLEMLNFRFKEKKMEKISKPIIFTAQKNSLSLMQISNE